jgi:hypothetical protein
MNFFKLTHPEYPTDAEADAKNPVVSAPLHRIPALVCPLCGTWASSERLRKARPPGDLGELVAGKSLPLDEWRAHRAGWSTLLGVPPEAISPGAEVSPPRGEAQGTLDSDILHPMPGLVWVTDPVA